MSNNYLVTGGAGFLGSAIATKLIESGNSVWIIDNLRTGFESNIPRGAIFIEGDCGNQVDINKLGLIKFDAIFHIAGQSSGEISFEDPVYDLKSNTISTVLLLNYAKKTGCSRFIYASTMSVYGDVHSEIVKESTTPSPKSFYAIGKLASENYLRIYERTYGISYSALRYFNIYGPGQNMENLKQGMISIYLSQLMSKDTKEIVVKGDLNRFRDFIYIDDAVNITLDCLSNSKTKNKIFNVGTGVKTAVFELLEILQTVTETKKPIVIMPETPGDQFGIVADTTLLDSINKVRFLPLESGIHSFVASLSEITQQR